MEARRHFLDGVGLTGILEAMPPEWRAMLEVRITEHLPAIELVELLERKLGDKGRAALKEIRKALDAPRLLTLKAAPTSPPASAAGSKYPAPPEDEPGPDVPNFLKRATAVA